MTATISLGESLSVREPNFFYKKENDFISITSLPSLPPVGTDIAANILSQVKTVLTLAGVGTAMILETYVTVKVSDGISHLTNQPDCTIANLTASMWQALSYILSPSILRQAGRAWPDSDAWRAEELWRDAKPIRKLRVASYKGGTALSWGLPGKIIFAPAMWKMEWAGKTVYRADYVDMLEFKAINRIPTMKYSLGVTADIKRSIVDGKESMSFCYKYLPIVDHLRRVDKHTIIGKMMVGNVFILYFTLLSKQ